MLKFVTDHPKTKKMCEHAVKKLPYIFRYVPHQYKTQQICDKAILENVGTLKSIPDCYKNQEMCNKAVDNYPHALEFVLDCYMTQEMCDKAFNKCFLPFFFTFLSNIKFRIISDDSFSLRYVPDQYKTQQMCDKVVGDCIPALKFVPDWFVARKMIKILFTALYTEENILYFNEDSGNVVFICIVMGILNRDLNNINLDNTNYHEDDPDTIIVRLFTWHIKFEKHKKDLSEDLMPIAWHPKRWWNFCVSEDEKKEIEIEPIFTQEL